MSLIETQYTIPCQDGKTGQNFPHSYPGRGRRSLMLNHLYYLHEEDAEVVNLLLDELEKKERTAGEHE